MKSKFLFWCGTLLLSALAGFAGYLWICLHWSYSMGERTGYVQKFSRKGWICKTWEGELTMMPVPGSIPEKFLFTVRDDRVAGEINDSLGKKVSINYEQHIGIPTSCFGDTEYFITKIRVLD